MIHFSGPCLVYMYMTYVWLSPRKTKNKNCIWLISTLLGLIWTRYPDSYIHSTHNDKCNYIISIIIPYLTSNLNLSTWLILAIPVEISGCTNNPCQNEATCFVSGSGSQAYICLCEPGWEGVDCSQASNPCQPTNPCMNGATCVNQQTSFFCQCPEGYTGSMCETGETNYPWILIWSSCSMWILAIIWYTMYHNSISSWRKLNFVREFHYLIFFHNRWYMCLLQNYIV